MPPKTKEKGVKAGSQKKKKNAGAGESGWVEVGTPYFSVLWLRDQAEVLQRELSTLHVSMELSWPSPFIASHPGSTELGRWGNRHLPPPLSPFWLYAFLVYSSHIF